MKKTQVGEYNDQHSLFRWFRCKLHGSDICRDETVFSPENIQLLVLTKIDEKALMDIGTGMHEQERAELGLKIHAAIRRHSKRFKTVVVELDKSRIFHCLLTRTVFSA